MSLSARFESNSLVNQPTQLCLQAIQADAQQLKYCPQWRAGDTSNYNDLYQFDLSYVQPKTSLRSQI